MQEQLGWKQIYFGQLTTAWAEGLTASQETIKGVVFYSRVIILIWKAVVATVDITQYPFTSTQPYTGRSHTIGTTSVSDCPGSTSQPSTARHGHVI